jgi:hypothetical protein
MMAVDQFVCRRATLAGHASSEYELVTPAEWTPRPPECLSREPLRVVHSYVGSSAGHGEVEVALAICRRDFNLEDWLDIVCASEHEEILDRCTVATPNGAATHVLTRGKSEFGPHIARRTACKDGDRMYHVQVRSAENVYSQLADKFLLCLASFRLVSPLGHRTAETLLNFQRDAPVPFSFQRLSSWNVVNEVMDGKTCAVELMDNSEENCGQVHIEVHRTGDAMGVIDLLQKRANAMKEMRFHLNGSPILPLLPPADFEAAAIYAPTAYRNASQFDCPVLALGRSRQAVTIGLLGPSRQESPEWWAINKRAFEVVRDSLRLLEEPTA